jgi:hypothetical protein
MTARSTTPFSRLGLHALFGTNAAQWSCALTKHEESSDKKPLAWSVLYHTEVIHASSKKD